MKKSHNIASSKAKNLMGYFPGPVFWDVDPSVLDVVFISIEKDTSISIQKYTILFK